MKDGGSRHPERDPSFRDPAGRLCTIGGRIIRLVSPVGLPDLHAFGDCPLVEAEVRRGRIISTTVLDQAAISELQSEPAFDSLVGELTVGAVLEHEAVRFPSYPHEWPPEMLAAAAELTLDLALGLLDHGLGLKDATPYNILFRGAEPVFIDVLSFERRTPGGATWLPYAQFVRTFLLPLLLNRHMGLRLDQVFMVHRDGLEPEQVVRFFGPIARLRPMVLTLVSLPARLSDRADRASGIHKTRVLRDADRADFILRSIFSQLKRTLRRLTPKSHRSAWSKYEDTRTHYSVAGLASKAAAVRASLEAVRPSSVLDVGCNVGEYSQLAARMGAKVVAIDSDPVVVGAVWQRARHDRLDILPLVVNIARPSPALGWRNAESPSFLERAQGRFDLVLLLAVMHHLLVSDRIPLSEIVDLAATLTRRAALVEYVEPTDPMFRRLARGRDELYRDLNRELFERVSRRRFDILKSERLPESDRWLYLLEKRQQAGS